MPPILEDLTPDLIAGLAERGERRTLGGHGIRTADAYVKGIVACADDEVCSNIALPKGFTWDPPAMLRESATRLVYSNEEMLFATCGEADGMKAIAKANDVELPPRTLMVFENIVTTPLRDRDGDILRSEGAILDEQMPLLWHHMPPMPVGKMIKVLKQSKKGVKVLTALIDSQLGHDAAALIEFGALRISHGFRPLEFEPMKDGGYDITSFEVLEESLVTVPSNVDAIITAFGRGKLCDPLVKSWAKGFSDARPAQGRGFNGSNTPATVERWNKSLGKGFDIVREHLEPSNLEYDWVSRWAGCQVKELYQCSSCIPSYRLGSWLTGLRYAMRDWKLEDTRSITCNGKEVPPQYEVMQLNSKMSDTFMVDGIQFYKGACCLSIKLARFWGGIGVTVYAALKDIEVANKIIDDSWRWAIENNFLKGEAFSLSGDFISKTDESWDDVFLGSGNTKSLKAAVSQINRRGQSAANRGMILMGEPGTGKTLSGRIIRNSVDATFVWLSSRDFYYSGAFRGMMDAFDLARELSPCVLFIEDVDNWMSSTTCDLLKTEMDGIGRSSGIITILTTNYPERLPDALIDRPGRFHDVLQFDLPDATIRRQMLDKWLAEASDAAKAKAVKRTQGYSGAHLYELAQYARSISESDELSLDKAVDQAISKIESQRELINDAQLAGSTYRPSKTLQAAIDYESTCCDEKGYQLDNPPALDLTDVASKQQITHVPSERIAREKAGRVLSAKNKNKLTRSVEMLAKAADLIREILDSSDVTGDEPDKQNMTATMVEWLDNGAKRDEIRALHQLLGNDITRHERAMRRASVRRLVSTTR